MFKIITGFTEDYDQILALYRLCTQTMDAKGIIQWNTEYPDGQVLKENILAGNTYIIKNDDQIIGTTTLDEHQDEQYRNIQWAYPSDKVLVVHRVSVHPNFQGKGMAKQLMYFAEEYARTRAYEVIRFDAYFGNPYSQRLYKSLGYQEAIGYCYYSLVPIMCNCFEKRIFLT